jgi:hypothetical protein
VTRSGIGSGYCKLSSYRASPLARWQDYPVPPFEQRLLELRDRGWGERHKGPIIQAHSLRVVPGRQAPPAAGWWRGGGGIGLSPRHSVPPPTGRLGPGCTAAGRRPRAGSASSRMRRLVAHHVSRRAIVASVSWPERSTARRPAAITTRTKRVHLRHHHRIGPGGGDGSPPHEPGPADREHYANERVRAVR